MKTRMQKSTRISMRLTAIVIALVSLVAAASATIMIGTGAYVPPVEAQSTDIQDSLTGTFTTIDVPGSTGTGALDINAEGMIVGRYSMSGQTHGFLRTPTGDFMTIDFPGANFTVAAGINDLGDIVGMYVLPSAPTQRHGYLLKDGVYSSFDPPGSTFTNALGINERGDIVGRYCTLSVCRPPGNGDFRAFMLHDGEFTALEAAGAIETNAFKINGSGKIGGGLVTGGGAEEIALWRKNTLTMMELPNGKPVTMDNGGINERGDVVGMYCDGAAPCFPGPAGTHGFLISDDEFHTINAPGAAATAAFGINARGDIVGGYVDSARRNHGFLLMRSQS